MAKKTNDPWRYQKDPRVLRDEQHFEDDDYDPVASPRMWGWVFIAAILFWAAIGLWFFSS